MQRSVTPIEVELDTGNGHELETVDAQALQVIEAVGDAIEGVVELFDLQLVDNQVIELRSFVGGVGPSERSRDLGECKSRKLANVGGARERIGEPQGDQLA